VGLLQIEHEESRRRNENAELAALGAAKVGTGGGQEGEEQTKEAEVDQETVERTLTQIFSLEANSHGGDKTLPAETMFSVLVSNDAQVQSCQLSEFELCGFAAEMMPDAHGDVAFIDHIKRWVPIIFELRKNQLLGAYLKDKAAETLGIPEPDLDALEQLFPLLPADHAAMHKSRRSSNSGEQRTSSRRKTGDSRRNSKQLTAERRHSGVSSVFDSSGPPSRRLSGSEKPGDLSLGTSPPRLRGSILGRASVLGDLKGTKEPPKGRGYQRRKERLANQMLSSFVPT